MIYYNFYISLAASTGAKSKLVYPLVARRARLAVFYFPGVLAVHLVMGIYFRRHSLIVVLVHRFFAARHQLKVGQSVLLTMLFRIGLDYFKCLFCSILFWQLDHEHVLRIGIGRRVWRKRDHATFCQCFKELDHVVCV